jgi:hypothetical protein
LLERGSGGELKKNGKLKQPEFFTSLSESTIKNPVNIISPLLHTPPVLCTSGSPLSFGHPSPDGGRISEGQDGVFS